MAFLRSQWGIRICLFGGIYLAQGAVLAYFLIFNVYYLVGFGFRAEEIGFFRAILVLPFILKFLIGLLSDRLSLFGLGHRYPYILLGLTTQFAAFLALPFLSLPRDFLVYFCVSLASTTGMALCDTCADGLAVESTPGRQRGLVQGVMVASRASGTLIALLAGSFLVAHAAWPALFLVVSVLTLPAIGLGILGWAGGEAPHLATFEWSAFRALRRREVLQLASIGLVFALSMDSLLSYFPFRLDHLALSGVGEVSALVAISLTGRILGGACSSALTGRVGIRRSLTLATLLAALTCLGLSLAGWAPVLTACCFLFGVAYGHYAAAYSAAAMTMSNPRIAASMFAIFMIAINLGILLGQAVGGAITEAYGFRVLTWSMAGLCLLNLVQVRRWDAGSQGAGEKPD